jgi:hypothetical protein
MAGNGLALGFGAERLLACRDSDVGNEARDPRRATEARRGSTGHSNGVSFRNVRLSECDGGEGSGAVPEPSFGRSWLV